MYRKEGYQHLKPSKRKRKIKKPQPTLLQQLQQRIIKVRTESFDNTKISANNSN